MTRGTRTTRIVFGIAVLLALQATAAVHEAKSARELLVLEGNQTGHTIKVAEGYLPESYNVATAIYAKGKPKFVLPAGLRVQDDGEGWWTVYRKPIAQTFEWTGGGGNAKWENAKNWRPNGVPGRLDTIKLGMEDSIDMARDRMVSNIVFSAKVILGGGAVHAQNTLGRGSKGKLGVRAGSCLGKVSLREGAIVAPLRGTAGYRGVMEEDADGVTRVVLTRPAAEFVWTDAAKDGKWFNEKNWSANGRPAVETPSRIDRVVFNSKTQLTVELPEGLTVVSNLVTKTPIEFKSARSTDILGDGGGGSSFDILDIAGNKEFTVRGNVRVCIKGGAEDTEIVVKSGATLALAAHNGKRYKSLVFEDDTEFIPYDWVVEVDRLVFKGRNKVSFWPPRKFNRWRPAWLVHAKHLEGEPNLVCDDMAHWGGNVARWNDGSSMLEIFFK